MGYDEGFKKPFADFGKQSYNITDRVTGTTTPTCMLSPLGSGTITP